MSVLSTDNAPQIPTNEPTSKVSGGDEDEAAEGLGDKIIHISVMN